MAFKRPWVQFPPAPPQKIKGLRVTPQALFLCHYIFALYFSHGPHRCEQAQRRRLAPSFGSTKRSARCPWPGSAATVALAWRFWRWGSAREFREVTRTRKLLRPGDNQESPGSAVFKEALTECRPLVVERVVERPPPPRMGSVQKVRPAWPVRRSPATRSSLNPRPRPWRSGGLGRAR